MTDIATLAHRIMNATVIALLIASNGVTLWRLRLRRAAPRNT